MLLRYGGLDVEYQVPTSSQRDQEFDNLVIDSEAEDELEEDEQTMPDDGVCCIQLFFLHARWVPLGPRTQAHWPIALYLSFKFIGAVQETPPSYQGL